LTERLEREVGGEYNTFRVYLYLLKKKRASARDVERGLGFSSPHLATHHLEKLVKVGLTEKEDSQYRVLPKSFGVLRLFLILDKWIVPKTFFPAVIFLTMAIGFLFLLPQHPYFLIALLLSIIGLIISGYLTLQFYRLLPRT